MSAFLRRALPALWYVALAVLVTWPLAVHPRAQLAALGGPGDSYLNLWILGWDLRTISESPMAVLDGRVFDAPIFHPARQTLAYSDHLLVVAAIVWPVYAMTGSVVLAYNVVLLGSLVASALAMHLLARRVTGSTPGALAAGTIWGFWPYHIAHLEHLQLQALYAMPLAFLALHRLVAAKRIRDAIGLGGAAAFMAATSVYYGVIGALGLVVSAVALGVTSGGRRTGRLVGRLVLAGIVGGALVAPLALPYWQVQQREGFARNLFEAARHAATPGSYVSVPAVNLLHRAIGMLPADGAEVDLFPGSIALLLAGLGVAVARRRGSWPLAVSAATLAIVGFILSLGPDGVRPVYAVLHRWVFGFQAIRAPARFGVLVTLGIAMLAAIGMREIDRVSAAPTSKAATRRRLSWFSIALLALLAVEYVNVPLRWVPAPRLATSVGAWLRSAPGAGAVIYLPLGIDVENTPIMLESLEHGRPIVNGYSGQRPAFFSGVVDAMHTFPSADALWTLKDLDVRFIVSPRTVDTSQWPLVERARFTEAGADGSSTQIVYELAWSDEAEARLTPAVVPVPPEPGPIVFSVGERLTYRVTWAGPAGTVDAGVVTLAIEPPGPAAAALPPTGAAYRFAVAARTAPWIARFFEADDRFITTTDSRLHPLIHERQLREGRRAVDQHFTFDAGALRARMSDANGQLIGPPLRLWPGSRDAVSTLYYVRTLELSPGQTIEAPVFENGRNTRLSIHVRDAGPTTFGGRRWDTVRLDVEVNERVPRRRAPEMTVWLARDPPRPLVAAEVRAVFGNLRIELENADGRR